MGILPLTPKPYNPATGAIQTVTYNGSFHLMGGPFIILKLLTPVYT